MNTPAYTGFLLAIILVYSVEAKQQAFLPLLDTSALITSEKITYDQDVSVITARGRVEILLYDQKRKQDLVLLADSVSYHTKYDLIVATGRVSLLETSGLVIFSEYLELQREFKNGIAQQIKIFLTDLSYISATSGIYSTDFTYNLKQVTYTTCRSCNSTTPLWSIDASNVAYDIRQYEITYRNALLKVLGLPIAYIPYLSHTIQTVEQKSGFLFPRFGRTHSLGPTVRIPYILGLSPSSNLIVEVLLSRKDFPVLSGEYQNNLLNREVRNTFSLTYSKKGYFGGHITGRTLYKVGDIYRTILQVEHTTSKEYMHQYGFGSQTWLASYASIEGQGQKSYGTVRAYSFRGLRTSSDWQKSIFLVIPVRYNYIGDIGWFGNYPTLSSSLLMLYNGKTINSKYLNIVGEWIVPHINSIVGERTILKTSLRGDSYVVNNIASGSTILLNNILSQIAYETSVEVYYPLVRLNKKNFTIVEPVVAFILTPVWKTTTTVPSIGSYTSELDSTNLFSYNHYVGIDNHIESGEKLYYGLKIGQYRQSLWQFNMLVGQIYKPNFGSNSDIVGQTEFISNSNFTLLHNFLFNQDTHQMRRSELTMQTGPRALQLSVGYTSLQKTIEQEQAIDKKAKVFGKQEEIIASLSSNISQHWNLILSSYYNIHLEKLLIASLTAQYENECLAFRSILSRDHTHDFNLRNGTSITVQIVLRTLGEMQNKFYLSG